MVPFALAAVLALPAAAQEGTDPAKQAVRQLKAVQAAVDGEIAGLDGEVVSDIAQAGDGRLKAVLRQGDALIKQLEAMHRLAKSVVAKNPPDPAPFHQVCKSLVDAACDGTPSGAEKEDGLLTALKAEDVRLRDALKRMRAERKGGPRPAGDACAASAEADSATRLASKASTRLALTAYALNQELADGELDRALDKAAEQKVGKGKAAAEIRKLLRRTQNASKARHKAFMKALTGKEKATQDDLKRLGRAKARAERSKEVFAGIAEGMKRHSSDAAGALALEVSLETEDVGRLADDIGAMLRAKKTFLVAGSTDPKAPDSRGVFPALKSAEAAVSRACGIRKGVADALAGLEGPR